MKLCVAYIIYLTPFLGSDPGHICSFTKRGTLCVEKGGPRLTATTYGVTRWTLQIPCSGALSWPSPINESGGHVKCLVLPFTKCMKHHTFLPLIYLFRVGLFFFCWFRWSLSLSLPPQRNPCCTCIFVGSPRSGSSSSTIGKKNSPCNSILSLTFFFVACNAEERRSKAL